MMAISNALPLQTTRQAPVISGVNHEPRSPQCKDIEFQPNQVMHGRRLNTFSQPVFSGSDFIARFLSRVDRSVAYEI